jgi:hypothetical protein
MLNLLAPLVKNSDKVDHFITCFGWVYYPKGSDEVAIILRKFLSDYYIKAVVEYRESKHVNS